MSDGAEHTQDSEIFARVDACVAAVERLDSPKAQDAARSLAAALLDLHGLALKRILHHTEQSTSSESEAAFIDDPLVRHVLLLHGVHPVPMETRIRDAICTLSASLAAEELTLTLREVRDGVVHLGLHYLKEARLSALMRIIEPALLDAAPDAAGWLIDSPEGMLEISSDAHSQAGPRNARGDVPLPVLR